jgi:hypothetical protein
LTCHRFKSQRNSNDHGEGESSALIRDVPSAREIIERTVKDAVNFMKRGRPGVEVAGD